MNPLSRRCSGAASLVVPLLAFACTDDPSDPVGPGPCLGASDSGVCFDELVTGLRYPLQIEQPPGESRLFVAEQPGRIRIIDDDDLVDTPFLDLSAEVEFAPERGLIGVAFHPDYASNGYLYVTFTGLQGNIRIERFTRSSSGDEVDLSSRKEILVVQRTSGQHNGGLLRFGPDAMLWIAVGDALNAGLAQDSSSLYGSLLRIDVNGGDPYAVPPDNPYVGVPGARPEIWATGLRNPWRFSFEPGGRLFIADVGQSAWEELNVVADNAPGLDFGWPAMEGDHCYVANCDPAAYTTPVFEYGHDVGCSIIGGTVYGRDDLPALEGRYVLADYCGWVGSLAVSGTALSDLQILDFGDIGEVTSLGLDADGRIYVLTATSVVRLRPVPEPDA